MRPPCPLDWRLFLPTSWDETTADSEDERTQIRQRRARAQIPPGIGHRPKWELALEMIGELSHWGLSPPVVVADAGYGDNGLFRTALTTRGLAYIVQVKTTTSMHAADAVYETPEYSGRGKPPTPRYLTHLSRRRNSLSPCRAGSIGRSPGDRAAKAH